MKNIAISDSDIKKYIEKVVNNFGPDESEYDKFSNMIEMLIDNIDDHTEIHSFIDKCEFLRTVDSIMGHSRLKPCGYSGDYLLIERIYKNSISYNVKYEKWDRYSLNTPAAQAVRNRKEYFCEVIKNNINKSNKNIKLLNVASGPGRDLYDLYSSIDPQKLSTTCLDADINAVEYSKIVNKNFNNYISYVSCNALRFRPKVKYDIIWSAGLFDYFDDKTFILALSLFREWLDVDGSIIIGNFSPSNPSKKYMEKFGDWYLHHRNEDELLDLAIKSGFNAENCYIKSESLGINLFLHC
ncbi:MAG: class I SAM-dependent methyltransferase [Flavobacteriales bacterium]|nr:class I SAM-dependent methyltransferase [Flavobacteriales bacterium]